MKKIKYLLLFFLSTSSMAESFCGLNNTEIYFNSSNNGNGSIIYSPAKNCFQIYDGLNVRGKFRIDGLEDIKDIPLQLEVSFSPNDNFLLVSFNAGESTRINQVYRIADLKMIFEVNATSSQWLKTEESLIYVPNYAITEQQINKGLRQYVLSSKQVSERFTELMFTGEMSIGKNQIVARAMSDKNEDVEYFTIIGDLATGDYIIINGKSIKKQVQ